VFKKKHRIKASDVKVTNTDNAPKRGRGRPKMDPALKKTVVEYVSTGRGRGRPKKNPDEIKPKVPYVKTGKPRGRPAKVK
jgi:hypothetical protein